MKRAGTSTTKNTNNSIKKAASDIIDSKKTNSKKDITPILTTNVQSGHGLWCIATDKKSNKEEYKSKQSVIEERLEENSRINEDFFNEIDKKLLEKLKRQVTELTIKLDSAMCKCSEAEYLAQRAENNKQIFSELADKRLKEIKEIEEKQQNLEENIVNLNEALSSAKKEISRLQTCLQVEEEKANNYYEMYQNLMLEKERRENNLSSEIHALSTQLNLFSKERENLVKVIQSSPNPNEMTASFQRYKDEVEEKLKANEIYISKLQTENSELKKKLNAEEANKNKFADLVKKKNDSIDYMKNEIEKYNKIFEDCKKEVKWNQNTVLQKENDLKVYGEKIKKLTEENSNLHKKIDKLKVSKGVTETNDDNSNQIKQKPFLFGPETDEC